MTSASLRTLVAGAALIVVPPSAVLLAQEDATVEAPDETAPSTPSLPCTAPEARQFDFWPGDWTVNNRYLTSRGWVDAGRADVRVYSALGGCLIIEHWRGNLGPNEVYGFSARAWDEEAGEWVLLLNWPQLDAPSFGMLRGGFRHGRGEFFSEGADEEGNPRHTRFSFADISPNRFRWDQAFSPDGESWRTTWIMEYSRRDPAGDPPNLVEPAFVNDRCRGDEYRAFDFLLGDWRATGEVPTPDGARREVVARVRAVPILGGCAVLDFVQTLDDGPPYQLFRIRSRIGQRWVQYWFDTAERAFLRFEGGPVEDGIELSFDGGEARHRVRWSEIESGRPLWVYEVSTDGGDSWRTRIRSRLER